MRSLQRCPLCALVRSIAKIAARHDALPESERPAAVIVLVITDGQENASTEWNLTGVQKAVTAAQRKRNWRFVFLGADANAFADAQRMGIKTAARYAKDSGSVLHAYDALHDAARSFRGSVREGNVLAELVMESDLTGKAKSKGKAPKDSN